MKIDENTPGALANREAVGAQRRWILVLFSANYLVCALGGLVKGLSIPYTIWLAIQSLFFLRRRICIAHCLNPIWTSLRRLAQNHANRPFALLHTFRAHFRHHKWRTCISRSVFGLLECQAGPK